jgi:hypothetical protein
MHTQPLLGANARDQRHQQRSYEQHDKVVGNETTIVADPTMSLPSGVYTYLDSDGNAHNADANGKQGAA